MGSELHLLRTGIPLIDRQHEAYEEMTGRILALCAEPQIDKATLVQEVAQVRAYALDHFDCEEQLMRAKKYPYINEHIHRHNIFREQSDSFAAELNEAQLLEDFTTRLSRLLVDWFCDHVQNVDMKLAAFLRKSGPASASIRSTEN